MADAKFSAARQSIYDAAIARQRENEARQRAQMTGAAARAGVRTSGVGQIGQSAISQEALRSEGDIGAEMASQEEQERIGDKRFLQEKEMYGMSLAEAARERARQRRDAKAGNTGQMIGAGITTVAILA